MRLRRGIEIHLTGDTRKAPEVLILQIRAVTPAHHLHCNEVLTRLQIFRDIKLCSHLRILRIADILAIHPQREVTRGRTYMEEHLLPFPVGRQIKRATIRTRIVVRLADIRGIALKGRTPGIADILIDLVAIAVEFEETRHWEIHPFRVVVLQREEILRGILMVLHKTESPQAFHRQVSARSALVALGLVDTLEGEEISTSWFTVLLVHTGITPHWGCISCIGRQ